MKNSDVVSENQLFYVVTIELFCLISLFLPGFLSGDLKQDSIIGLIVGFGFACIFALAVKYVLCKIWKCLFKG